MGKSIGAVLFSDHSHSYRASLCGRMTCPAYLPEQQGWYSRLQYQGQQDKVLIATPFYNGSASFLQYFTNLCCLTYPKDLISVVLLDGLDRNQSLYSTDALRLHLSRAFRKAHVVSLEELELLEIAEELQSLNISQISRDVMIRNDRLVKAMQLADADSVLWLDPEIQEIPSDIIQRLLSADQDIVIPSCLNSEEANAKDMKYESEPENSIPLFTVKPTIPPKAESKPNGNSSSVNVTSNTTETPSDELGYPWVDLTPLRDQRNPIWTSRNRNCVALIRANLHKAGNIIPPMMEIYIGNQTDFTIMAEVLGLNIFYMPTLKVFH